MVEVMDPGAGDDPKDRSPFRTAASAFIVAIVAVVWIVLKQQDEQGGAARLDECRAGSGVAVTYEVPSLLDTSGVGGDAVEHILGLDEVGVRVHPVAYGSTDQWYPMRAHSAEG